MGFCKNSILLMGNRSLVFFEIDQWYRNITIGSRGSITWKTSFLERRKKQHARYGQSFHACAVPSCIWKGV